MKRIIRHISEGIKRAGDWCGQNIFGQRKTYSKTIVNALNESESGVIVTLHKGETVIPRNLLLASTSYLGPISRQFSYDHKLDYRKNKSQRKNWDKWKKRK